MTRPPAALLPLLLLVLMPLALLAPALRPGRALLAVHTGQLSPWRATLPPERLAQLEQDGLALGADKALMFQPQLELAQRRLAAGEAPLWNPDVLCGVPLLAQAVHGVLSPPLLLAAGLGATRAWALVAALQVALAGWLMQRLAREYGLSTPAATLAGLGFAWCGYLAVRLEWYQIQGASVWLPAALLAVERAFRGARGGAAALLGAALGLSLLAGFPQASVHILYAAAALAAVRTAGSWRRGAPGPALAAGATCAAGLLLGLLLGAPQLLPSVELAGSTDSTRRRAPPEAVAGLALDPPALAAAVVPEIFGHPRDLRRHALPHLRDQGVLRRLLCPSGGNWVETTSSFGLPALLLALLGLLSERRGARVAAALFLAGALLSVRTPLLPWLLHLPGLDTGDPRRFLLLFSAGGALLAGFGLQRLLDAGPPGWYLRSLAVVATALLLLAVGSMLLDGATWVDLVAPALATRTGLPEAEVRAHAGELVLDLALLQAALLRAALLALLTAGAVLLATRRRGLAAGTLLLAAAADLLTFAARSASVLPAAGHFDPPPRLEALRDPEGGRLARFVAGDPGAALEYPLPPNTGLPFGVADLSGYITLAPRRVEALHERLQPGSATDVGTKALSDPAALGSPLLDLFCVSRLLSAVPLDRPDLVPLGALGDAWLYERPTALPRVRLAGALRLVEGESAAAAALDEAGFDPREVTLVEAAGRPEFEAAAAASGPPGHVRLVVDEPERLVLDVVATRPAVVIVADSWMPGWEARLDGRPAPLAPACLAFRAVAVPAGSQRLELLYRPAGWRLGLLAGLAGLAGLTACAWSARSTARRQSARP